MRRNHSLLTSLSNIKQTSECGHTTLAKPMPHIHITPVGIEGVFKKALAFNRQQFSMRPQKTVSIHV